MARMMWQCLSKGPKDHMSLRDGDKDSECCYETIVEPDGCLTRHAMSRLVATGYAATLVSSSQFRSNVTSDATAAFQGVTGYTAKTEEPDGCSKRLGRWTLLKTEELDACSKRLGRWTLRSPAESRAENTMIAQQPHNIDPSPETSETRKPTFEDEDELANIRKSCFEIREEFQKKNELPTVKEVLAAMKSRFGWKPEWAKTGQCRVVFSDLCVLKECDAAFTAGHAEFFRERMFVFPVESPSLRRGSVVAYVAPMLHQRLPYLSACEKKIVRNMLRQQLEGHYKQQIWCVVLEPEAVACWGYGTNIKACFVPPWWSGRWHEWKHSDFLQQLDRMLEMPDQDDSLSSASSASKSRQDQQ